MTRALGADDRPDRPRRWLRLAGPALAGTVLARTDLGEIRRALAGVHPVPVVVALALLAPLLAIRAWRWRRILRGYGSPIGFADALALYVIATGVGALTPGGLGDFSKSLAPAVGGRRIGFWASALDRFYDTALLAVLGVVVAAALAAPRDPGAILLASAASAAAAWGARAPIARTIRRIVPGLPPLEPGAAHPAAALAATLLAGLVAFARFALLVAALDLPIGAADQAVAYVLTSGVAALPLSIAGVGTRDAALVAYLSARGIRPASAVALSTLCLVLYLWNAVAGAAVWLFRPPRR